MLGVPRAEMSRLSSPIRRLALGHALQLHPLRLRVGVGELVVLPQPVQDLFFLQGGGGPPLVQLCHGPLQVQQVLVHLLARPVPGGPLRLQGVLLPVDGGEAVPESRSLLRQRIQLRSQRRDLRLGVGDVLPVGLHRPLLLGPVAGEIRAEGPQVPGAPGGGLRSAARAASALFLALISSVSSQTWPAAPTGRRAPAPPGPAPGRRWTPAARSPPGRRRSAVRCPTAGRRGSPARR